MNQNRRIEIHCQADSFAVVVTGDELDEPHLSLHASHGEAMTVALALQKSGEFAGASLHDKTADPSMLIRDRDRSRIGQPTPCYRPPAHLAVTARFGLAKCPLLATISARRAGHRMDAASGVGPCLSSLLSLTAGWMPRMIGSTRRRITAILSPCWRSCSASSATGRAMLWKSALFGIVKRVLDAGGHFLFLSQPMADSTTSTGRLFLAVLGGVADVEREMILTRTAEGRARSIKRMGRPRKLTPAQRAEALARKENGESHSDIARSFNVSHMTIQRLQS